MKKIVLLYAGMFALNAHSFETKRFEDFMVKWQAGQGAKQAQDRQPVTVLVRDTRSEETIEIKTALAIGETVQCNLNGQGEANVWQMRDGRTPCIVRTSKGGGTLMEGKLVGTKINGDLVLARQTVTQLQVQLGTKAIVTKAPLFIPAQQVEGSYTVSTMVGY